jgi:hypothetical protein
VPGPVIVSGLEGDLARGQAHQPLVGDGHPVGVAAEVMKSLVGAAERFFGVDDPLFASEFPKEARELRFRDPALQFPLLPGLL